MLSTLNWSSPLLKFYHGDHDDGDPTMRIAMVIALPIMAILMVGAPWSTTGITLLPYLHHGDRHGYSPWRSPWRSPITIATIVEIAKVN